MPWLVALSVVTAAGGEPVPAPARRLVIGPAALSDAVGGEEVLADAAVAWAREQGLHVWGTRALLVVDHPLRLDGGLEVPRPRLDMAVAHFLSALPEDLLAGLAEGLVVRLEQCGDRAADLLRGALPDDLCFVPEGLPSERIIDDRDRATIERSGGGRMGDDAWRDRLEASRHRGELAARYAELPHEPVVSIGLVGRATLVDSQGRPVMSALGASFGPGRILRQRLVEWDQDFLVPLDESGTWSALDGLLALAAQLPTEPQEVRVERSGLHELGGLVSKLAAWRPRAVEVSLEREMVYVAAGVYALDTFETGISMASGLCWRRVAGDPAALALTYHRPELAAPISADRYLLPLRRQHLQAATPADAPFDLDDYRPTAAGHRLMGWDELTQEQRQWLLRSVGSLGLRYADGRLDPDVDAPDLEELRLEFRLGFMLGMTNVVPYVDNLGRRLYCPAAGSGVGWPYPALTGTPPHGE